MATRYGVIVTTDEGDQEVSDIKLMEANPPDIDVTAAPTTVEELEDGVQIGMIRGGPVAPVAGFGFREGDDRGKSAEATLESEQEARDRKEAEREVEKKRASREPSADKAKANERAAEKQAEADKAAAEALSRRDDARAKALADATARQSETTRQSETKAKTKA